MSFLTPAKPFLETASWNRAQVNALRYNTSTAGAVIPLLYGTTRQQVQLIAFGNYRGPSGKKGKNGPLPVQGTHVGKGGGSSSKKGATSKKSQDYSIDVDFCLCQGPVSVGNNNWVWSSAGEEHFVSASSQGIHLYNGNDGQAADPTMVGLGFITGYSGTCHITGTPLDLGQSPVLPNISVEVNGFTQGTNTGNYTLDANPANIVVDFLTNSRYGAGFPLVNIDANIETLYGNYCRAATLIMSPVLQVQTEAATWISEIAKLTNTAIVWSGSILKFVPYGDLELNNNGVDWIPDLTVQYSVDDHSYLPWRPHLDTADPQVGEDDPVILTRTNPADAINWVSMEYWDRSNLYNPTVVTQFDQGMIDLYGLRTEPSIQGFAFTFEYAATTSARLILQRKLYVRNTYKFQLGWRFALLEPMDIIEITDTMLELTNQPVRIISIEENENGDLIFETEEISVGSVVALSPPASTTAAVHLDGGTWQNERNAVLTGSVNGSVGSFSVWFAPDPAMVSGATYRGFFEFCIQAFLGVWYDETDGTIHFHASDGTNVLRAKSMAGTVVLDSRWHHVAISWNVASYIGAVGGIIPASILQLYYDGNPILMSVTSIVGTGLIIPYASGVGSASTGYRIWSVDGAIPTGQDLQGCCQDFWLSQTTKLDFSSSSVLGKFRTVGGRAANLGSNGQTPTGTSPNIFLHYTGGTALSTAFTTNLGTGGPNGAGGWTTSYPTLCGSSPY